MTLSPEYLGGAVPPRDLCSFFVLRHGQTDLNTISVVEGGEKKWIAQGRGTNVGLNETGKQQARLAGNVGRRLDIKRVVSSPQTRAMQTAFLANLTVDFQIDPNLAERDFGPNEGQLGPLKMFEGNYAGCEDSEGFSHRVAKAMEHARCKGTLFCTHGGVCRVIAGLLGVELCEEHLETGRVLEFRWEGAFWGVRIHRSRVALVSGANRGIGRAIAKELLAHGYRVSLGARDLSKLAEVFGAESEQLEFAHFDAEEQGTMKAWVEKAVVKFGRIDALINNAGLGASRTDNLMDGTDEELGRVMTVNCNAPWHLTQLCMPHLEKAGAGHIVNVCSLSGLRVNHSHNFIYNASKHAQMALTRTTRCYAWERGVRVTAVCPGWVATEMSAHSKVNSDDMIQPQDIAKIVRMAIELPNRSSIATIAVNCESEALF